MFPEATRKPKEVGEQKPKGTPEEPREKTVSLWETWGLKPKVVNLRANKEEVFQPVPVTNVRTQAADIDQTINQEIVFARLCSMFAILALTIACVGLYATMAYAVARRTNEIGLRLALGADRHAVVWMMLRDVCVLTAIGLVIAIPTAIMTSRLIESFLFGTQPNDPRTIAQAAAVLAGAALAAGYGPARRASRVDPMVALRHD